MAEVTIRSKTARMVIALHDRTTAYARAADNARRAGEQLKFSNLHMQANIWRSATVVAAACAGLDPKYAIYGELVRKVGK